VARSAGVVEAGKSFTAKGTIVRANPKPAHKGPRPRWHWQGPVRKFEPDPFSPCKFTDFVTISNMGWQGGTYSDAIGRFAAHEVL